MPPPPVPQELHSYDYGCIGSACALHKRNPSGQLEGWGSWHKPRVEKQGSDQYSLLNVEGVLPCTDQRHLPRSFG